MFEKLILLDNLQKVKSFVAVTMEKDYEIDLISGKYLVNAKSIMGIFSLDLTKPLTVRYETDDVTFAERLKEYIFEE